VTELVSAAGFLKEAFEMFRQALLPCGGIFYLIPENQPTIRFAKVPSPRRPVTEGFDEYKVS